MLLNIWDVHHVSDMTLKLETQVIWLNQKTSITRQRNRAKVCLALLTVDWKSSEGESFKGSTVPLDFFLHCQSCTPVAEEKDYDVMDFIEGVHQTFKIQTAPAL